MKEAFLDNLTPVEKGAHSPIVITPATVVFDTRTTFNYSTYHIPESINFNWREFSVQSKPNVLRKDTETIARRLARLGVGLDTNIVLVGGPGRGRYHNARLAWNLYNLGLSKIQIADITYFKVKYTQKKSEPKKNAAIWDPAPRENLVSTSKDLKELAGSKNKTFFIDVRSEKEYFAKRATRKVATTPAWLTTININWKEFFDDSGKVNTKIASKLKAVGINKSDKIIVLSNLGLRSASVTFALRATGYAQASNYLLGLKKLR